MITLHSLDPSVSIETQLQQTTGPVYLICIFVVPREASDTFVDLWHADAAFMATMPGFRQTSMHRGTADSQLFYSIAEWESAKAVAGAITAAGSDAEMQRRSATAPDGISLYIHLFEKAPIAEASAVEMDTTDG